MRAFSSYVLTSAVSYKGVEFGLRTCGLNAVCKLWQGKFAKFSERLGYSPCELWELQMLFMCLNLERKKPGENDFDTLDTFASSMARSTLMLRQLT
jgi:hypothetical protein